MGNCRDCHHWAFLDGNIGECTLSELTSAESLHVAVVYVCKDGDGTMYRRTEDPNYSGVLETDASFGCISFEPRRD